MQLRRLEVQNIRSYESGRLDFEPGTTLIVGDVGAGKSSLLYAIEMALFGVAEIDAAYLVRHGTGHAEVAVRFEDGAHRYDIARRFRRLRRKGKETFESERITFREDGAPTSYSATEIRQRVIELLGFPDNPNPQAHSDLWRWAIYVPQERMREILSARPQERLETVRKALGVERYRIAAENAQEVAAELRALARHRRESADRLAHHDLDFAEATESADRLRRERVDLERTITERANESNRAREQVEEADRVARLRESDLRELAGLERDHAAEAASIGDRHRAQEERAREIDVRRSEAEEARRAAADRPALEARMAEAEARWREARDALERSGELTRSLAAARAEQTAAERQVREARERAVRADRERASAHEALDRALAEGPAREPPAPTPKAIAELDRLLSGARAEEHAALDRAARASSALAEVQELLAQGVCPRCHQPVRAEEFGTHRAEAEAAHRSAEAERRETASRRERIESERQARERYERARERWVEVEKRRTTLRDALEGREAEVREAENAVREGESASEAAHARVAALEPVEAQAASLRESAESAERHREACRSAVQLAVLATERARSAGEAASALARESQRIAREVEGLERRRQERATRLEELRSRVAAGEAVGGRLDAARADLRSVEQKLVEERSVLVRTDTRLDGEVRRRATAEKGRAERATLGTEAADLDRRAEWVVGPFRMRVLAMESEILAHAQVAFDRAFARYFASLVDDPALLARTQTGFTPEVLIEGEPTPAEALSGGERTALALAFRLALATVVRSLGEVRLETLLLDEPTDGFSSEQVIRMGELLSELALPQVIIVSHEAQLAGLADRTVRVLKQDGKATLETDRASGEETLIAPPPVRRTRSTRIGEHRERSS